MKLMDFVAIWITSSSFIFLLGVLITNRADTGKFFSILSPKHFCLVQKEKNIRHMDRFFLIWLGISMLIGIPIAYFAPLPLIKISGYLRDTFAGKLITFIAISLIFFFLVLAGIGRSNARPEDGKYFCFLSQNPNKEKRKEENRELIAYYLAYLAFCSFLVWAITASILKKYNILTR